MTVDTAVPRSQLHETSKVAKGRFGIAGRAAGQDVCWQVIGIRKDAFAEANRIVVDEARPAAERGLYPHPALHGQPKEKGLEWRDRPKPRMPTS